MLEMQFLVAGHETTSATLSFAYYNLVKCPEKFYKAQHQVDEVVGDNVLTVDMLPKLTYIDAVIKETLRENSPIPVVSVRPQGDQVVGCKYFIPNEAQVTCVMKMLHHDPKVWGDDAYEFKVSTFAATLSI